MQKDIIIAGVGGQGILTIASIIDLAAMNLGFRVKQAEVHGMSQRGGAVESHLRISSETIWSDLIPLGKADLILSFEPMEALRYLPFLKPDGAIVTAMDSEDGIKGYPDRGELKEALAGAGDHLLVDAAKRAAEAGSKRSSNIVMLGAATPYLGLEEKELEKAVATYFARKGEEVVALNVKAFRLGAACNHTKKEVR